LDVRASGYVAMKLLVGIISALPAFCDAALRTKTSLDSSVTGAIAVSMQKESDKIADRSRLLMPEARTLDSIQTSLLGMVKGRVQHGAAQAPSADMIGFLNGIGAMINETMKPNILNRKNIIQTDMDGTWANVTNPPCQSPTSDTFVAELNALSATHITCRDSESIASDTYTQCVEGNKIISDNDHSHCLLYNGLNQFPNVGETCKMKQPTPVPTIGHYLLDMEKLFENLESQVLDAKWKCHNQSGTTPEDCGHKYCSYQDQKKQCREHQADFEGRACEIHQNFTCTGFNSCIDRAWQAYADARQEGVDNQPGLQAEWRALLRIECLLSALMQDQSLLEAAIDVCKQSVFSDAEVLLTFHGVAPAKPGCAPPTDMQPGTALFGSRWYPGLPFNTPAETCAASCCSNQPYVPGYDSGAQCPYTPDTGGGGGGSPRSLGDSTARNLFASPR